MRDDRFPPPAEQRPILIVDDEPGIHQLLIDALVDEGYCTPAAGDGREALALLKQFTPGLILLDLRMPRMDGIAFAAALRRRAHPQPPVVVVTAAPFDAETLDRLGVAEVLVKPFVLDAVFSHVERLLSPAGA
ncbi:MAG TPA: response regulator [Dehalococcoidia bacterium]|nr:response regulator [Dehalococcoidia bacterium]